MGHGRALRVVELPVAYDEACATGITCNMLFLKCATGNSSIYSYFPSSMFSSSRQFNLVNKKLQGRPSFFYSKMPIWSIKLTWMCDLVTNLQIANSGSRSCHTRVFWPLRDGHLLFGDIAELFVNTPLILYFFSFENLISLSPSLPKNPQKKYVVWIGPGSSNGMKASDLLIWIWLNGGLIYFQLARGGGLPPHM
jgi:hypothetical protein